jgi:hypothetical protein
MQKKILASLLAILSFVVLSPIRNANANVPPISTTRFQITGTGKLVHFELAPFPAGTKAPVTNVTAADIASCIIGSAIGCTSSTIETDPDGKAFLYILDPTDSPTHIAISTNDDCSSPTPTVLEGLVDGGGNFMFTGHHVKSDTEIIVQGKVLFAKGTSTIIGIKAASILAISNTQGHYGVGKFSTVTGTATPDVSCPGDLLL